MSAVRDHSARKRGLRLWAPPLLAAVALLAAPLAFAREPATSFSVQPATFDPADPATRAYFKLTVPIGTPQTHTVIITNGGKKKLRLRVYPVDGLTGQTSGTVYANRGVPRVEAGKWVHVARSTVTLAPGKHTTVAFAVRVPPGSSPGQHLAGIAVENMEPSTSGGQFQIRQIFRAVVGVLVRVPGRALPRIWLGPASLTAAAHNAYVTMTLTIGNRGRSLCKPLLQTWIRGSNGGTLYVKRQLDTILPGDKIDYPMVLPRRLRPGTYEVRERASCETNTATRNATVELAPATP